MLSLHLCTSTCFCLLIAIEAKLCGNAIGQATHVAAGRRNSRCLRRTAMSTPLARLCFGLRLTRDAGRHSDLYRVPCAGFLSDMVQCHVVRLRHPLQCHLNSTGLEPRTAYPQAWARAWKHGARLLTASLGGSVSCPGPLLPTVSGWQRAI